MGAEGDVIGGSQCQSAANWRAAAVGLYRDTYLRDSVSKHLQLGQIETIDGINHFNDAGAARSAIDWRDGRRGVTSPRTSTGSIVINPAWVHSKHQAVVLLRDSVSRRPVKTDGAWCHCSICWHGDQASIKPDEKAQRPGPLCRPHAASSRFNSVHVTFFNIALLETGQRQLKLARTVQRVHCRSPRRSRSSPAGAPRSIAWRWRTRLGSYWRSCLLQLPL